MQQLHITSISVNASVYIVSQLIYRPCHAQDAVNHCHGVQYASFTWVPFHLIHHEQVINNMCLSRCKFWKEH